MRKRLSGACAPCVLARSQASVGCAQGVLQQLMESGTVSKLPEDLQWSIRLLVPRRAVAAAAPTPAFAAPVIPAAALPAQAEAPALAAPGVSVGQGVGSILAQQAGRPFLASQRLHTAVQWVWLGCRHAAVTALL